MREGVEGKQEEIASRHQLAALPFGAILTFIGARRRRSRDGGRSAATVAEAAPAVADRRGLYAPLVQKAGLIPPSWA